MANKTTLGAFRALTICGIAELPAHRDKNVTHVLSLLDPGLPELEVFSAYAKHDRRVLWFHDIIEAEEGKIMPTRSDVETILDLGHTLASGPSDVPEVHLLIHCHQGISRSTAAMLALLAQSMPHANEDQLLAKLRVIRPRAWPNSLMTGWIDEFLGRQGRLSAALRRHYAYQLRHDPELGRLLERVGRGPEVELGRQADLPIG